MSEKPSRDVHLPYPLPCTSIVYRMVPADTDWIADDGTPDPAMFYRKANDKDGVSVATTLKDGLERLTRRGVQGARSLHVGRVRQIDNLDVRSKGPEKTHAAITGLPYSDDDPGKAERLADKLLEISRTVPLPTS
jgi:hypothetical protein